MTHGDQAKAKTAKSSQASATKKSSSKAAGQGKTGKAGSKEAGESGKAGKAGKISLKKAGAEKGRPAAIPKAVSATQEAGSGGKGSTARPAPPAEADAPAGFTNAAVATAFKRALKKYPNAFRKLTD